MKRKKNHYIRILNQDDQQTRSTCQCPKWKLRNSQCAIKRRVPTDRLIKRHICFILSSSLTLLCIPQWSRHFVDFVFRLMCSSFDGELDFYLKMILFIKKKWLGVATYFCSIFKKVNKIRKKTLSVTPYFGKGSLWKTGSGSRVRLLIGKVR